MRNLIGSLFHFSAAATLFTLQQAQNAVLAPLDTQAALASLCRSLDAMSDTLASKLDPAKQSALDSMTRAQAEMIALASQTPGPSPPGVSAGKAGGAAA